MSIKYHLDIYAAEVKGRLVLELNPQELDVKGTGAELAIQEALRMAAAGEVDMRPIGGVEFVAMVHHTERG